MTGAHRHPRNETVNAFLQALSERTAGWVDQAACKNMNPNVFFPERGDNAAVKAAKAICEGCPVTAECGDAARHELYGVWAATTPKQRQRQRRLQAAPGRNPDPPRSTPTDTCGTPEGAAIHRERGQAMCHRCRAIEEGARRRAAAVETRRLAIANGATPPRHRPKCGTHAGHQAHRHHSEIPCEPCVDAYIAYKRLLRARLRTQGTT